LQTKKIIKMKSTRTKLYLLSFFTIASSLFAQTPPNLFGGIEIGSKGVKITVLDVKNAKKADFEIKDFWTENTGIAKGISIDGKLIKDDIEKTANVVNQNYNKLMNDFKIPKNKIFIIGSSGVAMAKNTADLVEKVKELTGYSMEFITSETEARLLVKGGIPPSKYLNALILDIGGGNTKGGFVGLFNDDNFVFLPLNLNLGTITLTEKIKKKAKNEDFLEYLKTTSRYKDSLGFEVDKMYDVRPLSKKKKFIYMSGGAVWAFATLSATKEIENFHEFTIQDVRNYQVQLLGDFSKFEEAAKNNKDIDRVLKTYSLKHLISANELLISTLEKIESPEEKKIYFVKQGQIAWLLAYVVETVKNAKVIY
jgi:exopolyphosphatase/pppGpp-phosphohydrolase